MYTKENKGQRVGQFGAGSGGQRKGRMDERGFGPGGECQCLKCGTKTPHERGMPCSKQNCPQCGSKMTRTRF